MRHEPKKEAKAHERAGEKRAMEHKKVAREHERAGMKKTAHKGGEKHVHIHHHVHKG